MTEQLQPVSTELRVERAIRAAARAGNRLIAGSTARIDVRDPAAAAALGQALRAMGARLRSAPSGTDDAHLPVDFRFVDDLRDATAPSPSEAASTGGLPETVADLRGRVRSGRGTDPEARIAWAAAGMPATAALAQRLREAGRGRTPRIGVSLVLEPKTAAFARALAAAGCEVAVFGAVSETDPEIAAALGGRGDVAVFAPREPVTDAGRAAALDAEHAAAVLDWAPELLIDDGSHLVRLAHTERPDALRALAAAAEETTSGVRPLHEMAAEGALAIPVIAVNDARTKTGFDNLIGTGQSCVCAILDLLDPAGQRAGDQERAPDQTARGAAGTRWTVIGYGPVGVGTARYAAALGAIVEVVEQDPVRALAAQHDGFEARSAHESLPEADVVVSATGVWHTLDAAGFRMLRPGTAVAVAGGIDDELALDELRAEGWRRAVHRRGVAEWIAPGEAHGPIVLADGGGVNYTAGEGNPVEVMDLSFATQLAALVRLLDADLAPGVHGIDAADERLVAAAALAARGGGVEPRRAASRPGGAAQHWRSHRYRMTREPDPEQGSDPEL